MSSNLSTFKTLLAQRLDEGKKVPSVILKENNDLGQDFARLVTSEKPVEGETAGQRAGRYLDEICASLGDDQYSGLVSKFEDVVEAFTSKMKAAWDSVSGIRESGKTLAARMETITNDQLTANDFVAKHLNYSKLMSSFPVFGWDGTKIMGSIETTIQHVNGLMTQDAANVSDQVNKSLYDIITSDMTKFNQIEDVTMTEDSRKTAIEVLTNICQSSPAGDIEAVVDAVTGINKNCPVCESLSRLKIISEAQFKLMDNIKLYDNAITAFFPILDLIANEQVVPVPSAKDTVISNAKKMITVLELAAYYEYMQRTTTFREALLLQGGLINSDLQDDFKTAGGKPEMLAEFLRFMYQDDATKIPVSGIKISSIIEGAPTISEKVKKDIANVESRVALARNQARSSAYRIVMREYIAKVFTRNNTEIQASELATKVEAAMKECIVPIVNDIRQYQVNFIDAAMNGIVAVEYKGTFVEHLFQELGAAYISATEANGNVTAEDLKQVDVCVISKLVSTFLVDRLIEVVPEGSDAPVVAA